MMTLIALVIIAGGAYAFGWAQGSKDGFDKAVEQLDRIIDKVMRSRR